MLNRFFAVLCLVLSGVACGGGAWLEPERSGSDADPTARHVQSARCSGTLVYRDPSGLRVVAPSTPPCRITARRSRSRAS